MSNKTGFNDNAIVKGEFGTCFNITEVFCDVCGKNCMHEGNNYVGISMDVSNAPKSLRDELGVEKVNTCYGCWFESLGINKKD